MVILSGVIKIVNNNSTLIIRFNHWYYISICISI